MGIVAARLLPATTTIITVALAVILKAALRAIVVCKQLVSRKRKIKGKRKFLKKTKIIAILQ